MSSDNEFNGIHAGNESDVSNEISTGDEVKGAKDFQLEELEKPLTEQEMKDAAGGAGSPQPPGMAPGLYVQVVDGLINVTNSGGAAQFAAGQFGYTPSMTTPPIIVPNNPGLKFTPPPTFSPSVPTPSKQSSMPLPADVIKAPAPTPPPVYKTPKG